MQLTKFFTHPPAMPFASWDSHPSGDLPELPFVVAGSAYWERSSVTAPVSLHRSSSPRKAGAFRGPRGATGIVSRSDSDLTEVSLSPPAVMTLRFGLRLTPELSCSLGSRGSHVTRTDGNVKDMSVFGFQGSQSN